MWGFSDFFFSSGKGKCLSFIFNATRLSQCVCLGIIVRGCRLKGGGIFSVEIIHIGKIQTISFSPYQNLYRGRFSQFYWVLTLLRIIFAARKR